MKPRSCKPLPPPTHAARPLWLALACQDAGAAYAKHRHTDHARPLLDQAIAIYERLGAARNLASAEAILREMGIRRGRRGHARPAADRLAQSDPGGAHGCRAGRRGTV
jgi:hypothetical protein